LNPQTATRHIAQDNARVNYIGNPAAAAFIPLPNDDRNRD